MAIPSHYETLRAVAAAHLVELCTKFPLGYTPELVWRGYRVTAGLAYYRKGVIGLSSRVLREEQAVLDTLTHEYAHLLAVARHGNRAAGHGPAWQQAMADLGQEAKVRHNYEVERNVPRQTVVYTCKKCGAHINRSRRLPRRRKYMHAACGGEIRLLKIERITSSEADA